MKNHKCFNTISYSKIVLVISLSCLMFLITGCKKIIISEPLSSDILVEVEDISCTVKEAAFRLMEVKSYYKSDADADPAFWSRSIGDTTMEQYVKDSVRDELIRITAGVTMADKMAVYISDEEEQQLEQEAMDSYSLMALYFDLSAYDIELSDVISLYRKKAFYNKLYEKLSEAANDTVSEADTKLIEVNYAILPTTVSYGDAEDLRHEIKDGTDFKTACDAKGYEAVMNQVLVKGEMPSAFDDLAFSLVDGEISEIVETTDHFYIIQCLEDYMINESVANYNEKLSAAKKAEFDKYYTRFAADAVMRFNEDVWDSISVSEL